MARARRRPEEATGAAAMPDEPRQLQRSTRPARGFVCVEEGHAKQASPHLHDKVKNIEHIADMIRKQR